MTRQPRWFMLMCLMGIVLSLATCGEQEDEDSTDDDSTDDDSDSDDDQSPSSDGLLADGDAIARGAFSRPASDDDNDTTLPDGDHEEINGFPVCRQYAAPRAVGRLDSDYLIETSGIAVSLKNPGVLWAHNDSGDGPHLYAFDLEGSYLGRVKLAGVAAFDWEDMAVGPCGDDECLYVGDIGDNGARRTDCGIYRAVEPEVNPYVPFGEIVVDAWEHFPFRYPDGPRDAEALAVHPDGSVYIFSKYPGATVMYVFPELTPNEPVVLERLGEMETGGALAMVTSADIHRGGTRLLLRTYISVLELRLEPGEPFFDVLKDKRLGQPFSIELLGEAIAYDPATGDYLHVAEGSHSTVYRVACEALH